MLTRKTEELSKAKKLLVFKKLLKSHKCFNNVCLYVPETTVKIVTALEVDELGDDGDLRMPNLVFDFMICRSVSSDGPTWYLDCKKKKKMNNIN